MKRSALLVILPLLALAFLNFSTPSFANSTAPINPQSAALDTIYTLNPVADAFVNANYPSSNHGSDLELRVDDSPIVKSYLRFNVSGLSGAVTKATLRLYPNSSLSTGFKVFTVLDNSWGESTLTYKNEPGFGSVINPSGAVTQGTWVSVDVTSYVTGNGTFSFGLKNPSATSLSLASREAGNKPQLVITTATSTTPTATRVPPTATSVVATLAVPTATKVPPTATKAPPTPTSAPSGGSLTVNPLADAHVNSAYATTNYGAATELKLDGSPTKRGYLRFNVSGLSSAVSKATLRFYANSSLASGVTVKRVADNTWGETTITYNNAPAVGTTIATMGAATTGAWVSVDVTSYVTGNGTYSFALVDASSSALGLASREAANKPQLVVQTGTGTLPSPTPTSGVATLVVPTATQVPPTATATRLPPTPTATPSGSKTCNFTIGTGVGTADGFGNYSAVKPGNTVCIAAGNRSGLKLINFKGTASAPITFINSGGKVVIGGSSTGLQVYGSQHVRITGTGDPSIMYGIEIGNASNAAVETNHPGTSSKLDGTEYIEFDHIYSHDVGAGFRTAKNNDLLDTGIVWSGHQFYIHDNYIKTTTGEAMYIGTSDTHGTFPIYDVQVWNNRIDDAGFDGIQIRQAHTRVLVHHNVINGTGRDPRKNGTIDNTAAFNIAKGTDTGDWYDNTIIGARTAFYIKDSANVRVYDNLVIDSGHSTPYTAPEGGVQIINAKNVQFLFNTVVNTTINGAYGIQINGSSGTVRDNIVGGTFGNLITGTGMTLTNNLASKDLNSFKFVNPGGRNFRLMSGSPAINIASSSSFPTFDMDGIGRPQGTKSDVGAYEYH